MHITAARMMLLCPSANLTIVSQLAPAFEQGAAGAQVTTLLRRAHLMAQLAHESGHFRRLVENLSYSAPRICEIFKRLCPRAVQLAHNPVALGNAAYANKNGNGTEATGDGHKFLGRGVIQLTGRGNYRAVGPWVGLDLENHPEQAEAPANAVAIAYAFWTRNGCNQHADRDDVVAVTKAINGGLNGLEERKKLTQDAKGIFV